MEPLRVDHLTIRELLQQYPETIKVFIQFNTQCVGCSFEHFCTLADVAEHYPVSLETLTRTIQHVIHQKAREEKNEI